MVQTVMMRLVWQSLRGHTRGGCEGAGLGGTGPCDRMPRSWRQEASHGYGLNTWNIFKGALEQTAIDEWGG